jgi:hypothetical protein
MNYKMTAIDNWLARLQNKATGVNNNNNDNNNNNNNNDVNSAHLTRMQILHIV